MKYGEQTNSGVGVHPGGGGPQLPRYRHRPPGQDDKVGRRGGGAGGDGGVE